VKWLLRDMETIFDSEAVSRTFGIASSQAADREAGSCVTRIAGLRSDADEESRSQYRRRNRVSA
jgi:hypothetical protein